MVLAHVRRQSLPVWPLTFKQETFTFTFTATILFSCTFFLPTGVFEHLTLRIKTTFLFCCLFCNRTKMLLSYTSCEHLWWANDTVRVLSFESSYGRGLSGPVEKLLCRCMCRWYLLYAKSYGGLRRTTDRCPKFDSIDNIRDSEEESRIL